MGIEPNDRIDHHHHRLRGRRLTSGDRHAYRGSRAVDAGAFSSQLKTASESGSQGIVASESPGAVLPSAEVAAITQNVRLQMNNSILRLLSETESESPADAGASLVGSYQDVLSGNFKGGPIPSNSRRVASENSIPIREDIEGIIQAAAAAHDVDPDLIKGVIQAESNFNPGARSPVGAMGLMQLMPATAKELGVKNPFDPASNVMGGTRYLKQLLNRYDGNVPRALAAYNWGMGNLESSRGRLPTETRNYISKITKFYQESKSAVA